MRYVVPAAFFLALLLSAVLRADTPPATARRPVAAVDAPVKEIGDRIAELSAPQIKALWRYLSEAFGIEPAGPAVVTTAEERLTRENADLRKQLADLRAELATLKKTSTTRPATPPATRPAAADDAPGLYRVSAGPNGRFSATVRAKNRDDAISKALQTVARQAMDWDENAEIKTLNVERIGN